MNPVNPFAALGLPQQPDLDDETVRTAWRQIAADTHPDRPDGGDLARYTQASAAYAELRTPWGRSEAYADLVDQARRQGRDPDTEPLPAIPCETPQSAVPPWRPLLSLAWLPSRIARGRPGRLLVRAAITSGLSLAVLALIPSQPAAPADITGLIVWFILTGRKDLAPSPERRR